MTSPTTNTKFSTSVGKLVAAVRELQEQNTSQTEILAKLDVMIHDIALFTKGQRAQAVKAINTEFKFATTLHDIKAAGRAVKSAAMHVDGLSGTATVKQELEPAKSNDLAVDPATPRAHSTPVKSIPTGIRESVRSKAAAPAVAGNTNTETNSNTTEETTMRTPQEITADAQAKFAAENGNVATGAAVAGDHVHATAANNAATGAALTGEELNLTTDIIAAFLATHPQHQAGWNAHQAGNGNANFVESFKTWVKATPAVTTDFLVFLKKYHDAAAASAPISLGDRVMTTLRGDRDSGLRSGVVAAGAAVIGGGLEMAFKGSVGLGSALGTAAGATGAYFAAEAADGLMESETGRYIVAGSIGVVAGGLGSRIGRVAQDRMSGVAADAPALVEAPAPAPSAPTSLIGNSSAIANLLGM